MNVTYAPASAAARASEMVSRVLRPPTPATMGVSWRSASSSVARMKRIKEVRSSKLYCGLAGFVADGGAVPSELLLLGSRHTQGLLGLVLILNAGIWSDIPIPLVARSNH